jgi:dUTP pyrophosphatase
MLFVPIVPLDPDLPLPSYAHEGDAGLDLRAREAAVVTAGGGRALVPTGISIAIPVGWAGFVLPRSGLALQHGIGVVNAPGLIDAAYRGEIKVMLLNTDPEHDGTTCSAASGSRNWCCSGSKRSSGRWSSHSMARTAVAGSATAGGTDGHAPHLARRRGARSARGRAAGCLRRRW